MKTNTNELTRHIGSPRRGVDLRQRISNLSPELRKLLALKLEQQDIGILQIPVTKANRDHDQGFPLSFGQQRLWFIQQLEPHNTAYNLIRAAKLEGNLDKQALGKSINEIIRRHEILRTIFIFDKEKPFQVILPRLSLPLEIENLKNLPKEQHETKIKQVIRDESQYSFDLAKGPLLRTKLLVLGQAQHIFLLVIHHIISDGTSIQVFIRELVRLYQAYSQGKEPQLAGLRVQYADYASWQQQWLGDGAAEMGFKKQQEDYWLDRFKGEIPVLSLPFDFPRPAIQDFNGNTAVFSVGIDEASTLKEMALKGRTTLYVVLLSLCNIFLSKLSGVEDIIVGTPVAGRRHPDIQDLIGMFVNTLVLRNSPHHDKTFTGFLAEVKENTLSAFENQEYRYEDIVEKVNVSRDTSRSPLFDVMFLFKNVDYAEVNIPGLTLTHYEYDGNTAKFDLTLGAWEDARTLHFSFEYCTKLFRPTTMQRFVGYFKQLVREVVGDCQIKLAEIDIVPDYEKKKILVDFNDTAAEYPKNKTIHQLFEEQVERTPDHTALAGPGSETRQRNYRSHWSYMSHISITYRELNKKADQLTQLLVEKGVKPDTIVGIMVGRSIEMIIGILGILKAGGAYMPIDPEYPEERVDFMLKDSNAKSLLTNQEITILSSPQALNNRPKGTSLFGIWNLEFGISPRQGGQLAYIIYTSGTSGKPKGVMVEHKNVIRLVINSNYVELGKETRILQTGALTFDAAVFEIWGVLLNGGTLYLAPRAVILDARQLAHQLKKNRITTLWLSSALFNQLLQQNNDLFSGLEWLLVGGDVLSPLHINLVRKRNRKLKIVNGYGPTENTTFSTTYRIEKEFEDKIPIGKPIGNSTAYILDQYNHLQPLGAAGELYVGGDGVSRGYLNNPELTFERFPHVPVVFNRSDKSHRSYITHMSYIYRTGDLARWLPDGNIEFLGRLDQQIKIRGFRIELAEIEYQLLKHDSIKEAAVMAVHQTHGSNRTASANENKYINAYIVSDQELSTMHIREFLAKNLPVYMIPSHFIKIENLPLTLNGKVDKKALINLKQEVIEPPIPPRCVVEEKLTEIWSDLLNIQKEKISIHDNFFFVGGDSMKITMMALKLQKVFHASIPLTEIFKYPSIKDLGAYIMQPQNKIPLGTGDNVVTLRKGNNPSNHLFLIHPADGGIEAYVELCNHLSNFNCWGIREDFDKPAHPGNLTINGTAKKYTEIIKQIQPHGPYYIVGWSLGGTFAYEIARHLENQSEKVNFLGMIEGTPPRKKILIDFIIKRPIKREDYERNFTFNQAYEKYQPKGKINTIIHYLGTDMKRKDRWKGFSSQGIIYYEFPGDHFTLVRLPTVVKVAGLINKIINAAG